MHYSVTRLALKGKTTAEHVVSDTIAYLAVAVFRRALDLDDPRRVGPVDELLLEQNGLHVLVEFGEQRPLRSRRTRQRQSTAVLS